MTTIATRKAGIRNVEARNEREKIRVRNSRSITSQIVRPETLAIAFSNDANEDVLQRGLAQLEAQDASEPHCAAQEILGVGAGAQDNVGVVAAVYETFDAGKAGERSEIALDFDSKGASPVGRADLPNRTGQDSPAPVDQADLVAQALGLVHAMSGKEDGATAAFEV